MPSFLRLSSALLVSLTLLSACSGSGSDKDKDKDKEKKTSSQVAVKVNDGELSVHQVNEQLARMQGVAPEQLDLARKQIVEGLIDQKLLMQQAMEKKLDRDPDVLSAMEQNRTQILAQAYLQKTLAAQARPSAEEVKKYYADNPALFSQRRVFRLQELATNIGLDRVDELKKVAASSKNMNDVAAWLRKNNHQVAANSAVRGAEQLPMGQVERISALKDGEIAVFTTDQKVTVLQVLASQPQAIDEAKATPLIEQFLGTRKREELGRAELKRLRDTAKIEYVGDFVKLAALKAEAAASAPASASTAGAAASAAAPAIDKGVAGLR